MKEPFMLITEDQGLSPRALVTIASILQVFLSGYCKTCLESQDTGGRAGGQPYFKASFGCIMSLASIKLNNKQLSQTTIPKTNKQQQ